MEGACDDWAGGGGWRGGWGSQGITVVAATNEMWVAMITGFHIVPFCCVRTTAVFPSALHLRPAVLYSNAVLLCCILFYMNTDW